MKKVVIVAGGTGGHIYPAIAIAEVLRQEAEVLFITQKGRSSDLLKKEGYKPFILSLEKWNRKAFSSNTLKVALLNTVAIFKSFFFLRQEKPSVVVGMGGFVSFPAIFSSWLLSIPILICEQNAVFGLANRILSRFSREIALSYEETLFLPKNKKTAYIGNPVRRRIGKVSKKDSLFYFGLDPNKNIILIIGGSQGAASINKAVFEILSELSSFQILWMTGGADYPYIKQKVQSRDNVRIFTFLYEMEMAYGASSLVISRAGATALAEIAKCGLPAVLIPYPTACDNHQLENARRYKNGVVIEEKELTAEKLLSAVFTMKDKERLPDQKDSTQNLVFLILEMSNKKQ
ncbi:MAG: undecaprenyldiphospho-muramoylpentapeptide beta-N-acetylglucosaminyltransferase [Candidatus Desantisbacteria bacterium]